MQGKYNSMSIREILLPADFMISTVEDKWNNQYHRFSFRMDNRIMLRNQFDNGNTSNGDTSGPALKHDTQLMEAVPNYGDRLIYFTRKLHSHFSQDHFCFPSKTKLSLRRCKTIPLGDGRQNLISIFDKNLLAKYPYRSREVNQHITKSTVVACRSILALMFPLSFIAFNGTTRNARANRVASLPFSINNPVDNNNGGPMVALDASQHIGEWHAYTTRNRHRASSSYHVPLSGCSLEPTKSEAASTIYALTMKLWRKYAYEKVNIVSPGRFFVGKGIGITDPGIMFWVPLGLSWITLRPTVISHSAVLVNGQRARELGNRLRDILNALEGIGLLPELEHE
ncbi:hypothetical protein V1477_008843, partial [Vespula maculifrons]